MNWIDPIFFNKNKQECKKTEYIFTDDLQKQNQHIFPVLSAHECKIIPHRQCEAYYNYRRTESQSFQSNRIFTKNNQIHFRKLTISSLMICRNTSNTPSQSYQHTNAKSSHIDSVRRITTIGEPCPFSSKRGFFLRFSSCSAKRETLAGLELYGIVWIYLV